MPSTYHKPCVIQMRLSFYFWSKNSNIPKPTNNMTPPMMKYMKLPMKSFCALLLLLPLPLLVKKSLLKLGVRVKSSYLLKDCL